jgi:hypothetical protein
VVLLNCIIFQNGGPGVVMAGGSGSAAFLQNTTSAQNSYGLATASGNSVMNVNSTAGVEADPGANVLVDGTAVEGNGTGVASYSGTITINNSDIVSNGTGITGTTYSYGNNRILGNNSAGTTPTRISTE